MLFIYLKQVQWAKSNMTSVWTSDGSGEPTILWTAFTGVELLKLDPFMLRRRLSVWSAAAAAAAATLTAGTPAAPALARAQRQLNILVGLVRQ